MTIAETKILWIQEAFSHKSKVYENVVKISSKWNAAVELLRFLPDKDEATEGRVASPLEYEGAVGNSFENNGGIENNLPVNESEEQSIVKTNEKLALLGLSGGGFTVKGDEQKLLNSLQMNTTYVLVIIGEVFKYKEHASKLRAIRELKNFLNEKIKAPVITSDELTRKKLFSTNEAVHTLSYLIMVGFLYFLVFHYQDQILSFIAHSGWYAEYIRSSFLGKYGWLSKILVSLSIILLVPAVAFAYGNVTRAFLKWIKIE